jgi:hypothetical protein
MKRLLLIICLAVLCLVGIGFGYVHFHSRQTIPVTDLGFARPASVPGAPQPDGAAPPKTETIPSALVYKLPPGSAAVVFADVARLRASSFANELGALAPSSKQDPQYTEFVRDTGFDYSRDLDRVALALWPQSAPTSVVALADGKFDANKIKAYALQTGKKIRSSGHEIYEVPEQDSKRVIRFSFLSPSRIVLADGPALEKVLSVHSANRMDPAMISRVSQVSGAAIFAVARTQDLAQDIGIDASRSAQLARMLKSVRNITVAGQPVANNFNLSADAECDSSFDALELMTLLDGLRWMGRAALADPRTQQQIGPQWAALDSLLKAAALTHDRQFIRLRVQLTQKMLAAAAAPPQQNSGAR